MDTGYVCVCVCGTLKLVLLVNSEKVNVFGILAFDFLWKGAIFLILSISNEALSDCLYGEHRP